MHNGPKLDKLQTKRNTFICYTEMVKEKTAILDT